jgi:hypothetical protein
MSGIKKTTLLRIRTYAHDLDEQRSTSSPKDVTAEIHTVTAEPVVVSRPKMVTRPVASKPIVLESKTIFPPQEKIETPISEINKSLAQPEPTVEFPTRIPSFHELEQELQKNINPKKPDTSAFSQPYDKPVPRVPAPTPVLSTPKPQETIALSGGTVITDTKRAKFNLLEAIIISIQEFFESIATQFNKPKAPPKYTVAVADRRKGVIQKATSKTGTIFTADNETLKEEILRRQRERDSKRDISWSPNTEVGYPLIENKEPEPIIQNVAVVFKNQTTPRFSEATIPPEPLTAPSIQDERRWSEPVDTTVQSPQPVTSIPVPPAVTPQIIAVPPPVIPQAVPVPPPVVQAIPVATPLPAVVPASIKTPVPISPSLNKPKTKLMWFAGFRKKLTGIRSTNDSLATLNSNVIALTIIGVVVGIGVIGLVSRPLLELLLPQPTDSTTTVARDSLIRADQNGSILFTTNSVNSIEQIVTAGVSTTGGGITEISFIDTNEVEITPPTLFTLFGFRTNQNFNQSVSTLRLLSLDTRSRGFLFEVTDPTTVFGAMLEWEARMYSDLGPLLNLTVTQPGSVEFIDRTIGQRDVRILEVNGQEIITYGFITNNVLLITTTTGEFSRILQTI